MRMLKKLLPTIATLGVLCLGAAAQATPVNLLSNGSFETGYLTGWANSGAGLNNLGAYGIHPEDGGSYAGTLQGVATLSQTFTDIKGDSLSLSGYGWAPGSNGGYFSLEFNNVTVGTYSNYSGYWYGYQFLTSSSPVIATGRDTITVSFGCGAQNAYFCSGSAPTAVDNFSAIDTTPPPTTTGSGGASGVSVPEPAALSLLALALFGGGLLRRKSLSLI